MWFITWWKSIRASIYLGNISSSSLWCGMLGISGLQQKTRDRTKLRTTSPKRYNKSNSLHDVWPQDISFFRALVQAPEKGCTWLKEPFTTLRMLKIILEETLGHFSFVHSGRPKITGSSQFKWKGPKVRAYIFSAATLQILVDRRGRTEWLLSMSRIILARTSSENGIPAFLHSGVLGFSRCLWELEWSDQPGQTNGKWH